MTEAEVSNYFFWLKIQMGGIAIFIITLFFYIISKINIK